MKNVELLLAAKESILTEPEHFNMERWAFDPNHQLTEGEIVSHDTLGCGTTMCIAGWVVHHAVIQGVIGSAEAQKSAVCILACDLMGLDDDDFDSLCLRTNWPKDLMIRDYEAFDSVEESKIAAERIDRFIKEHNG